MTLDDITEKIKQKMQFAGNLHEKVLFDFEDEGQIFVDATETPPVVLATGDDPDVTLVTSLALMEKILNGEQDPSVAFMLGKLKVRGSLGIALKLNSILES